MDDFQRTKDVLEWPSNVTVIVSEKWWLITDTTCNLSCSCTRTLMRWLASSWPMSSLSWVWTKLTAAPCSFHFWDLYQWLDWWNSLKMENYRFTLIHTYHAPGRIYQWDLVQYFSFHFMSVFRSSWWERERDEWIDWWIDRWQFLSISSLL